MATIEANFSPPKVIDFETFIALPENADKKFESIGGEISEMVSSLPVSNITAILIWALMDYIRKNPIGFITSSDGGYMVTDDRYIPDVGYISKSKYTTLPNVAYCPLPPDLAVEVISPTDYQPHRVKQFNIKLANYLAAGTVVWVVYPESAEVLVYEPGQAAKTLSRHDTLMGGNILPNFELALKELFPDEA